jgi:cardiolipin synthase
MFQRRVTLVRQGIDRCYKRFCERFPRISRFLGFIRRRRRPLKGLLYVVAHTLGLVFSIQAVMQTRTEQGAVAWAFALNTVPLVAVPAWLVFGNTKVDSYEAAHRVGMDEVRPLAEKLLTHLHRAEANPGYRVSPLGEIPGGDHDEVLKRLETIASLPLLDGNSARLLVDGEATFDAILDAVSEADRYILMQFYIFREDGIGKRMRDALVAKARDGVAIHLLLDNLGSIGLSKGFISTMTREGIQVRYVMDVSGSANRFQLNFRNHRKILVVDGKRGFLGGLNVGDEYLGHHAKLTPWRDTHMEWRGPIVKCLQVPFAEDWRWATGDLLDQLDWEIRPEDVAGEVEALCLATGPADPFETCAMGFLTLIDGARKRIWIATPYFVPDDKIVTALQLAAMRGVEVRVILPGLSDSHLIHLSSFSYLKELEDAGVKFYRYEKGFLHQKVMLIDDSLSAIGSANLDNRSFRLNFEVIGIVSDTAFNSEVSRMLEADFANSRPTGADALAGRSFPFRLSVRLARMLAPIQ